MLLQCRLHGRKVWRNTLFLLEETDCDVTIVDIYILLIKELKKDVSFLRTKYFLIRTRIYKKQLRDQ